ncbi:hypothetical protein Efla_003542 [Eimeria flavescens]
MEGYYGWDGEGLGEDYGEEQLLTEQLLVLQLGSRIVRVGLSGVCTPHVQLSAPFVEEQKPARIPVLPAAAQLPSAAAPSGSSSSKSSRVDGWRLPEGPLLRHALAAWLRQVLGFASVRSLSERSLLLVESPLLPPALKHAIADLCLNVFQIPGVAFLSDLVAPLYTCGLDTGLVVDIGFSCCRVQPTCFGSPLPCALRVSNGGTAAVLLQLQHELAAAAASPAHEKAVMSLGLSELEDMAIKLLYVRYDLNSQQQQQQQQQDEKQQQQQKQHDPRLVFQSDKPLSYLLKEGLEIIVSPETRWRCAEVLFGSLPPDEVAADVGDSLVDLIISSLESCPSEARRLVIQNILLCGGFASCRGLSTRLSADLMAALKAHKRLHTAAAAAALGVPPSPPAIRQWCGASLHASLAGLQLYTQSDWLAGTPLPDWASIEKAGGEEAPLDSRETEKAASFSLPDTPKRPPAPLEQQQHQKQEQQQQLEVQQQQQQGPQQQQQQQERQQHQQHPHVTIPKLQLRPQQQQRGPHLPKPPPPRSSSSSSSSSSISSSSISSNGSSSPEGEPKK